LAFIPYELQQDIRKEALAQLQRRKKKN